MMQPVIIACPLWELNMWGFYNIVKDYWLTDFQTLHFETIGDLIAAQYESEDAFRALHGDPAEWEKRAVPDELLTPPELPVIYAALTLSGGDGKTPLGLKLGHPQKGIMTINGDLRATPDAPGGLPISISYEWRISLCKVRSEINPTVIDSIPLDGVSVINNQITWEGFDPQTLGIGPGIYMISDQDFAPIPGAAFGLPSDYRVELVNGPVFFKVLR